ncbi:MAG: transporter substrate-binding domain-containing protein, partial [Deltaproteobacteria bacterium]|nr:transporter substrate-binding domain-containing protein [Deltaproteobacteria bacterium]
MVEQTIGHRHLKVRVIMIPTARDELFSGLVAGRGDIALGNITVTPERLKIVDFSDPFAKNVKEIVVAGKVAPVLNNLDDLAGRKVFVRTSSSYYESLKDLNEEVERSGRKPMDLLPADESFEDEDLLEMANAGLISFIVVDEHKAAAWEPVFENVEHNIHAGVKYLRFIKDRYFEKEPMNEANRMLFTFASYNAGPARVAKLRLEAEKKGFDPNVWFRNVEIVAAKRIGRETVQYVSNIYKYYTAYRLIM